MVGPLSIGSTPCRAAAAAPALLSALVLLAPSTAAAHAVTVDGSAVEWGAVTPPFPDLGEIRRDAAQGGEFVWRDATGDALPFAGAALDLTEVRVTGDRDRFFLLARMTGAPPLAGTGAPMLQVAIDTGSPATPRQAGLACGAETSVGPAAAWSTLLVTRFGSGRAPLLLDAAFQPRAADVRAALSGAGVIEVSIPWSAFGSAFPPPDAVRFTVALFGSTAADSTLEYGGPDTSDVVDAVTGYGAPGTHPGTWQETRDGVLDHAFEVGFDPRGEPRAPLLITEVSVRNGNRPDWVEIYNAAAVPIALDGCKLGDAAAPGGGEGMGRFPAGTRLEPGRALVVAGDGAAFLAEYGRSCDAQCDASDPAAPSMLAYPAWAASPRIDLTSNGDEVLLLDRDDTVLDVMVYKSGGWPGVVPYPGAASGQTMARRSPGEDTDDCSVDFAGQSVPTPGTVPAVLTVEPGVAAPVAGLALSPNPFRGAVTLALTGATAAADVLVLDVRGRRVRTIRAATGLPAGGAWWAWDGRDDAGRPLDAGVYFFRVPTASSPRVARGVLLR